MRPTHATHMAQRVATGVASTCIALAVTLCALLPVTHLRADTAWSTTVYAGETAATTAPSTVTWPMGSINVNTATAEELCTLYGVGPALAEAILAEREAAGPFDYPEDLAMVKGIGVKTLAKFYDQLDFSARAAAPSAP
jgi:competence ComEA-like helix-hairpin-helix protein